MDYLAHPQFFLNMLTEYLEEGNAVVVNQSNSLLQICFCGQTGQNLILICWLSSVNRLLTTGCDLILETFQSNLCFVGNFVKEIPKDFFSAQFASQIGRSGGYFCLSVNIERVLLL